jgi:hypothetical protein
MTTQSVQETVDVEVGDSYIKRLAECPVSVALQELVWNAVDSGATRVDVGVYRDDKTQKVGRVEVSDNGSGISKDVAKSTFRRLGTSTKTTSLINKRGKKCHGRLGEGRFRGYALGTMLEWDSIDEDTFDRTQIKANFRDPLKFQLKYFKADPSSDKAGTKFAATDFSHPSGRFPKDETLQNSLAAIFAPKLLADKELKIYVNGSEVSPMSNIEDEIEEHLSEFDARIRILFWKKGQNRDWFWCDEDFNVRIEEAYNSENAIGPYSIFISISDVPADSKALRVKLENEQDRLFQLKNSVKTFVDDAFRKRWEEQSFLALEDLKEGNLYPYQGIPTTHLEKIERKVFDYCAVQIFEKIPSIRKSSADAKKLTLQLLRQALEISPPDLQKVLSEVLKLTSEEIARFSALLERTSLSRLIELGRLVSDRLDFLKGLEEIVVGDTAAHVKERVHLHKILETQTWIFGERYSITSSDETLNTVLDKFAEDIGAERSTNIGFENFQEGRDELVQDADGLRKIPDLILGRQVVMGDGDRLDNLVIELKAPTVKIGVKEVGQVRGYAATIAANKAFFDGEKTIWTFYAISSEISEPVAIEIADNKDPAPGRIHSGKVYDIYVVTWSQIIQSARGRMQYLREKLEIESTTGNGMQFLESEFPEIMQEVEQRAAKRAAKKEAAKGNAVG